MNLPTGDIFSITNERQFSQLALETYRYQFHHVELYREYCTLLKKTPEQVTSLEDIPFLPIQFFKSHTIISNEKIAEVIFESSGTTGTVPSRHFVADVKLYEQSFVKSFERSYGKPADFAFLALLPSYLERDNSSLIYMANSFIVQSNYTESGFFLNDFDALQHTIETLIAKNTPAILLGVTYALLDFAAYTNKSFEGIIVMETGGMKGRRKEMVRNEVHEILCKKFNVPSIHAEYGMTELLSQAYSKGNGLYDCPPWMRICTRNVYEPTWVSYGAGSGAINIIDLANRYSCSFIATEDIGTVYDNGTFNINGRLDHAAIRGCNLMIQ